VSHATCGQQSECFAVRSGRKDSPGRLETGNVLPVQGRKRLKTTEISNCRGGIRAGQEHDWLGIRLSNRYRGVAILDDKIFFATWDMQLIAISATTGQEIWHTTVDEDDYGHVIGRGGRTAQALRTVVKAAGSRQDRRVLVDIVD